MYHLSFLCAGGKPPEDSSCDNDNCFCGYSADHPSSAQTPHNCYCSNQGTKIYTNFHFWRFSTIYSMMFHIMVSLRKFESVSCSDAGGCKGDRRDTKLNHLPNSPIHFPKCILDLLVSRTTLSFQCRRRFTEQLQQQLCGIWSYCGTSDRLQLLWIWLAPSEERSVGYTISHLRLLLDYPIHHCLLSHNHCRCSGCLLLGKGWKRCESHILKSSLEFYTVVRLDILNFGVCCSESRLAPRTVISKAGVPVQFGLNGFGLLAGGDYWNDSVPVGNASEETEGAGSGTRRMLHQNLLLLCPMLLRLYRMDRQVYQPECLHCGTWDC